MKITLVTHNVFKVQEFRSVLEPEITVDHLDFEYPELRSDDPSDIVKAASKVLAENLKKPVVVEDSGFFIDALDGFPGTCTAYIYKRIGNPGFLKLMRNVLQRRCWYKSAIGYCAPGKDPVSFTGQEEGRVALTPRGEHGWGQDPIFIPKGKRKTYGELRKEGDVNKFRKDALLSLRRYLLGQRLLKIKLKSPV